MAARSKLTPATQKRICEAIRLGATYVHAANAAGISYETFNEWRKTKPQFSEAIQKAEGECVEEQLRVIRQAASERNWQASAWILERRYPDDYGRRERQQLEHSGGVTVRNEVVYVNDWKAPVTSATEGEAGK